MSINRDTFRHTAIYSAATILAKLVGFFMLPFYAQIFRTEGYGIIGILDASLGILSVLFATGFSVATMRFYHEERGERRAVVISSAIWMTWILGVGAITIPFIFSGSISNLLFASPQFAILVRLALLALVVDTAGQSASTYLIIKERSVLFSTIGVLRLFIAVSLNILLVVVLNLGLLGVFIGSLMNACIAALIFHWTAFRETGLKCERVILIKLLRFQLPMMSGDLVAYLSRQTERFLVRYLIDLRGVGILEMAYKFPPLLALVIGLPFLRAWRPKCMEIAEQEDAPEVIGRMFTFFMFGMVFGGLLLFVNIRDLLMILTPPEFWSATRIAKIEIVTTVLSAANLSMMFGLLYKKKTATISLIKSVTALIKVGLGYAFIRSMGLDGAAWSALVTEIVILVWTTKRAQEAYHVAFEHKRLFTMSLWAAALGLALTEVEYSTFGPAVHIKSQVMPWMAGRLSSMPVGSWKNGIIIQTLLSKQEQVIGICINSCLALAFLALVPIIRPGAGKSILRRLGILGQTREAVLEVND
jgi:O-antigen/teichoic acid export membrane protein